MSTFFTSDLHLGHTWVAETRGFDSINEHDLFPIAFEEIERRMK